VWHLLSYLHPLAFVHTQPIRIDDKTFTTTLQTTQVLGEGMWLCNATLWQL